LFAKKSPLSAATLSLVAIPCGLLGMSVASIVSYPGSLENRMKLREDRKIEPRTSLMKNEGQHEPDVDTTEPISKVGRADSSKQMAKL
jgi:hypothetical protein